MSGHNKWSKIKHKKAASDSKKAKVFSKYSTMITMEVKKAGGNTNSPNVLSIVERAKRESMPKENIERALQKGAGGGNDSLQEIIFEGYGPGGVALIIKAVTDNNNRTAPEIKHVFTKAGLELGVPGSALWAFSKEGDVYVPNLPMELDETTGSELADFIEQLEDHDDITDVFSAADSKD